MKGPADGRIGPNFEKRLQESTDRRFGPNFSKGFRDSRTADLIQILIFKKGCKDPLTVESVQIFKGEYRDPRTVVLVRIFKEECREYQMGLDRGQKSDRAVKWIFKLEPWSMEENWQTPTSGGQIWAIRIIICEN